MKFFALLSLSTLTAGLAIKRQTTSTCTDPVVRQEWRSLTEDMRSEYVAAVQCLTTKDSRLNSTMSLYDDFAYVHRELDTTIHEVSLFFPWHRYFVQTYEDALRDCGYTGHATYWDWSLDYSDPFSAPVFNTDSTGFGGDGDATTTCVATGVLADLTVKVPDTHCLQRSFSADAFLEYADPVMVNATLAITMYSLFRPGMEDGPHRSAHGGVRGDMLHNYSPNDPIFFLHHTNVDRLWWTWQQADPDTRLTEYSGNRYQNDADTEATITDPVPMVGITDDTVVSELMSTETGPFCYTY
ncbi:hypothetical protein BZA05DRAFT_464252 [Tricharina praecox]|uniref:uncharacterized protein n=1 Tax=Tricharina praecox TaxID=43433 RepID=UPI00221F34B6|nr:uncharacterized protein BZA05DRAFT_464252 [Tricharina praecox]KAI5841724.1 hypothetical protein BZA05DRAFT_464252 [Tricharina praecox]